MGWKAHQSKTTPSRWEDGAPAADFNPFTQKMDDAYAQTRWIPAIQNDFAARADWCIKDYKGANHAPKISVKANYLSAKPGQKLNIQVTTSDPDRNFVTMKYWQYQEVGNTDKKLEVLPQSTGVNIVIPSDAKSGDVFHLIAEGTDTGKPALTRYQRIVISVK